MEEKLNVLDFIKNIKDAKSSITSVITRKYIPSNEKDDIVNYITTVLFSHINTETKRIDEINVYQEPDLFLDELMVATSIIGAYTNIDMSDRTLVFDTFMEYDLYEKLIELIDDAYNFNDLLHSQIKAKREFIRDSRKTSMDEVLESLTGLVNTLNSKAQELDVKKLEKVIKKLNPEAILKAYQKSGIGEDLRDKAIQKQAQEIIDLKNQISARNVMA
jgi:hypothetical protein